jgi:hypothetical protein
VSVGPPKRNLRPMTDSSLARALFAVAGCDATVERLHKLCCEPERSPDMMAIEDALEGARLDIGRMDPESLDPAVDSLGDVGARLGSLQVAAAPQFACRWTPRPFANSTTPSSGSPGL